MYYNSAVKKKRSIMKQSDLMVIDEEQRCAEQFKTKSQTKLPQDPLSTNGGLIFNMLSK